MNPQKTLEFHGKASGYFVVFLVTLVMVYIPFFGWAFALNFTAKWLADNALVNGKKVAFTARYGESLKFIFINTLILIVTLGIYVFWYTPKLYRYLADHTQTIDDVAVPVTAETIPALQPPVDPTQPQVPTTPAVG